MTGAAERIERLTGQAVRELRAAGSQHRWTHYRVVLADGQTAFAKVAGADLGGVFEAEVRGLRWLGEAGAIGVPEVLGSPSQCRPRASASNTPPRPARATFANATRPSASRAR